MSHFTFSMCINKSKVKNHNTEW